MKLPSFRSQNVILGSALVALFALAPPVHAQYGSSGQQSQPPAGQQPPAKGAAPAQQAPAAPQVDPEEEKAYRSFVAIKPEATDQQIQAGEQFLQKYPTSTYAENVLTRLVPAYFQKQQYDKMYAAADKALLINPNEVSVLTLVGWVIPHNYDPNDIEADRRLDKAEGYEKRALELLATVQKPPNLTEEQFAKTKASALAQAHSGLGLVYFRKQDYPNSVAQMQQATTGEVAPDPVDLYILGVGLDQLKKFSDAAAAFQKCSQISGAMQDRCKQQAAAASKLAASQPAAPAPSK